MLICPRGETADFVYHGIAIIIIIIRVARCNDRIRRQFPGTREICGRTFYFQALGCMKLVLLVPLSYSLG